MDFNDNLWTKLATVCEVSDEDATQETSEAALWAKLAAELKISECKCAECKYAEGEDGKCATCGEKHGMCGERHATMNESIFDDDDKHRQVDAYLSGHKIGGNQLMSVQGLVSPDQPPRLTWPPQAGTKVAFSQRLEALLAYRNPPGPDAVGHIVRVRTAAGDTTHQDGQVFVKWTTGDLTVVHRDHLSPLPMGEEKANAHQPYRVTASSLGDLTAFFTPTSAGPDLVHKATQDLWALEVSEGEYVLERLFDASGAPLKL